MAYTLLDGVAQNAKHPTSFEIPCEVSKRALHVGDHVKICAESPNSMGERFWVRLTEVDDRLAGEIDNDLVFTSKHGLSFGDTIQFEPRHILAIYRN